MESISIEDISQKFDELREMVRHYMSYKLFQNKGVIYCSMEIKSKDSTIAVNMIEEMECSGEIYILHNNNELISHIDDIGIEEQIEIIKQL